jgi:hypothetical protein
MALLTVSGIVDGASVDSYDISSPHSFSVARDVDAASPQFEMACALGTEVGDVTLVAGATLVFSGSIITAYQVFDETGMAKEHVTFNFLTLSHTDG